MCRWTPQDSLAHLSTALLDQRKVTLKKEIAAMTGVDQIFAKATCRTPAQSGILLTTIRHLVTRSKQTIE